MNKSLILAAALAATLTACATTAPGNSGYAANSGYGNNGYNQAPDRCADCGRVERIEAVYGARPNSRTGAVLGGVVGAVVGRELADDESDGRQNTATVVGAVGGAVAGNAIENRVNAETYDIHVRMNDGRMLVFNRNTVPNGMREGAYVRVDGNRLVAL
jgi:outer membrane lipoprotein SlyB